MLLRRSSLKFHLRHYGVLHRLANNSLRAQAWADAEQLKPALIAWLEEHRKEVMRLAAAVCEKEQWRERPSSGPYVASSATELQRVLAAALNSLLDLDVPLHGAVMRLELDVLGEMVALYASYVRSGCEDPRQLVRPPPPLTRYKKSLSVKAQAGKDVTRCSRKALHCARHCRPS